MIGSSNDTCNSTAICPTLLIQSSRHKETACDENDATDVRSVVLERSSVGCLCHADALVRLSDFLAKEAPRRNTVIVLCSLLSICSQPMIDLFST
jgi:hypothetical protein